MMLSDHLSRPEPFGAVRRSAAPRLLTSLLLAWVVGVQGVSQSVQAGAQETTGGRAVRDGRWTVYLRRAGEVRIGMSLAEVRATLGDPNAGLAGSLPGQAVEPCAYLASPMLPSQVRVMVIDGRVARVEVRGPGIRTASGIGVGSTEAEVRRTYQRRITVAPHKYTDGHYLVYTPNDPIDRGFGLVFETDGARVTAFRAGTAVAVALVEGCA